MKKAVISRYMSNISQADFNTCPYNVQYILARYNGNFIAKRLEGKYMVRLYYLSYFYAEIWIEKKSQQTLYSKTFIDPSNLDPYLEYIDISHGTGE